MIGNGSKGRGIFWAAWAVVFAVSACAASKVNHAVIEEGVHSGKRFPTLQVEAIGEEAGFKALFAEIHSGTLPPPPPPEIDFEKWLVVFISPGEKPSAGYRVRVDEVTRTGETLRVKIGLEEPPADRFHATVITRPYVLVKIKKEPGLKRIALVDDEGKAIQSRSIPGAR